MADTYLQQCLKNNLTVRWPDGAMPLRVYLAPFHWYEQAKQANAFAYNQMIMECMNRWTEATGGKVRFQIVGDLNQSQINFVWRRADRKSLGHCEYSINKQSMIYSAEISIGISDGIINARYNDPDEVRHTILHEIGHALGLLDHSDQASDIMFVPHQYGVVDLSARDEATIQALYDLPVGFDFVRIGREKYQLTWPYTLNEVLSAMHGEGPRADRFLQKARPRQAAENPAKLSEHQDILTHQGKFHLMTQHIRVDESVRRMYTRHAGAPPPPEPDSPAPPGPA
ncbi:MAG: matrixin family metalloprotease [Candidatus Melainabacteria bacterium]